VLEELTLEEKFAGVEKPPTLEKQIQIKTVSGERFDPEVIWFNKDYDVALLHTSSMKSSPAARLECRAAKVSEKLVAVGNPFKLEHITTYGYVAGTERSVQQWRSVFMFNGAVLPGMSGGQVTFADTGELAGITVAVIGETSMGLVVPATAICHLMGRG
jgi:S1-C subfamily serine protease